MGAVTVYFATNRQPELDAQGRITGFGSDPGPIDGYAVRFGSATVNVDLAAKTNVLDPSSLIVAPETLTGAPGFTPLLGSRTIFTELRDRMKTNRRPTLVFIHGFSNSFQDSIERGGWNSAFYADAGFQADIFVFSWPSRGGALLNVPLPYLDYEHDRGTAAASGPAIARTLRILYDFVDQLDDQDRCLQELHLLCHSMGVFVLRNALQAWLSLPPPPPSAAPPPAVGLTAVSISEPAPVRRTFDQILLAAGDEDDDAFDDPMKLELLPRLGNAVTVYHTKKDWVLNTLSSRTKFNGPRLGTNGPDNMSAVSDKVAAVDVSDVIDYEGDLEGHQYYRKFPDVRDDIVGVLSGKRPTDFPKTRKALSEGRWLLQKAKPGKK
ncbi:MAG TPA: alpha/beta fold hydrolase [Rhizomicrobium sp.]|jgi:esterase/lipase superfamily enzyme